MSDDDDCCLHLNIQDNTAIASDDESNTASIGSSTRLSDDSGIEDWSDDMTVQTELQQPLRDEKHSNSPIVELLNTSISPIKDEATLLQTSTECIFPMLPDLYSAHEAKADTKQDVLREDAVHGVAGLYNLGNTCFMNAALQCLFVTQSLKDLVRDGNILLNGSDHMDEPANVILFVERFQELFQKVLAGKYSLLRPDQFHNSVARLHPTLGDYKQHDSQEFLSFLLNTLHELMNRGRGKLRANVHNSDQNNGSSSSDFSDSISGDVSMKRLKMDSDVDDSATMEPDAGVDCEENVSKAEAAWRAYTADNQSQIVDSFHGQFQSVIICDKCSFISTTYEPFMSLSLPIPYAMEKQFILTWVPSLKLSALPGMLSAIKYCITVNKNATCSDLKSAFLSLRRKADNQLQADHIVLVEAKQSANVSVLDDRTLVSYITKSKDIYAIEVVQPSDKTNSLVSDILLDGGASGTSNNVNGCADMCDSNGHLDSGMVTPDENTTSIDNIQNSTHMDISSDNNNGGSNSTTPEVGCCGGIGSASVEGAATWHSCGICLEEIFDEELRVHLVCGGLLCDPCLGNMIEVVNSDRFPCPICNRYIGKEDYTPLVEPKQYGTDSNGVKKEAAIRQILVPVMFRHDLSDGANTARKFRLFGHPVVCSLPSQVEVSAVFEVVSQVLKNVCFAPRKFHVIVTDGTGLSCGVCDLFSSCSGCRLKDDGSNEELLKLKPGCCISVHFRDDLDLVVKTLTFSQEDDSMKQFRNSDTVALEECLAKFGDTEVLTKDNPWYCTKCQTNQIAVKSMTVTRWPDTLIIHLKRFYFEGNQCCKIECPVVFPIKGLSIDVLTCADGNVESSTYDLYSFICHSGTLFGGHYTAHAKTSTEAEWNFFNDESVEKMDPPTEEENQKAYVLFYQRKGTV